MIIIVEPATRHNGSRVAGMYFASLEGETEPLVTSPTPFLCAARVLLARGFAPEERITMRWRGDNFYSLAATLGAAARLAVKEGPLRFVRYRPQLRLQDSNCSKREDRS